MSAIAVVMAIFLFLFESILNWPLDIMEGICFMALVFVCVIFGFVMNSCRGVPYLFILSISHIYEEFKQPNPTSAICFSLLVLIHTNVVLYTIGRSFDLMFRKIKRRGTSGSNPRESQKPIRDQSGSAPKRTNQRTKINQGQPQK